MPVNNQRIAKNTAALYLRMLLLMAVSLYTTRVILATLGVDDYGIYNLIGGFITLFSFISNALVAAMQRFFNVALGHNDREEYQRIYSMGVNIFALFSLFLLVVGETIGLWFIKTQLNIPLGRENAALWVYQISIVTLIVNLFRTPDNASIIAHEKMGFYAYISIFEALLKLGIVFMLRMVDFDKLILYVLLYLTATLLINLAYKVYCLKTIPDCRYSFLWDKDLFKRLVSFSGWSMLSGGTRVLKGQGDSYLLNHYYSVAINAAFGVAALVYNTVNSFLTSFQTAFKPQLVQSYAANELESHYKLINRSAKLSYFLLFLIVVPVVFNLDGLLGLWLEEVPKYTKEFCFIVLMAYLMDAMGAPLAVSVNANGNIKGINIISSVLLVLGLMAGFLFLRSGASPYIVVIITFFIHFGYWCSYMFYARKLCGVSLRTYAKEVVLPIVLVSVLSIITPLLLSFVSVLKWMVLLICIADVIWVGCMIYFVGLHKDERTYLFDLFFRKLMKKNNALSKSK